METKTLPSVLVGIGISLLIVGMFISGCSVGSFVRTKVPEEAALELGQPGLPVQTDVTHDEGVELFGRWQDRVRQRMERDARVTALFQRNLSESGERVAFIEGLGAQGLELAVPYVQTLPFGGFLATALVGLGGWLFPRPGESKAVKAAEDRGYDLGRNEAIDTAKRVEGQA